MALARLLLAAPDILLLDEVSELRTILMEVLAGRGGDKSSLFFCGKGAGGLGHLQACPHSAGDFCGACQPSCTHTSCQNALFGAALVYLHPDIDLLHPHALTLSCLPGPTA